MYKDAAGLLGYDVPFSVFRFLFLFLFSFDSNKKML